MFLEKDLRKLSLIVSGSYPVVYFWWKVFFYFRNYRE